MLAENGIHIFLLQLENKKQKELGETAAESTEETSLAAVLTASARTEGGVIRSYIL